MCLYKYEQLWRGWSDSTEVQLTTTVSHLVKQRLYYENTGVSIPTTLATWRQKKPLSYSKMLPPKSGHMAAILKSPRRTDRGKKSILHNILDQSQGFDALMWI